MPSLAPSRDEIASRKQTAALNKGTRKNPAPATAAPAAKGGQGGLWAMIVLLLALLVGGGWFGYEQFKELKAEISSSQQVFQESSSMIGSLESKLEDTGKQKAQTDEEVGKTLKLLDSEVRKLWALSNKRNKGAIAANKDTIAQLKKQISGLQSQLKQSKELTASQAGIIDSQKQALETLNVDMGNFRSQLEQEERANKVWRMELEDRISSADVEEKVESNSMAIQSIDFFRQQMNSEIERINREIRLLNQKTASAPGVTP